MPRNLFRIAMALVLGASGVAAAAADVGVGPGGGTPGTARNFAVVGHDPLFNRGMNAALALYTDPATDRSFVYVGNRTDGSLPCSQTGNVQPCHASANVHSRPGILIEEVTDPAAPTNVGEIGAPHAAQPGITTRELRVWPEQQLLMVMTFRCSSAIHDCPPGSDTTFPFDIKFFDLADPVNPRYIGSYVPTSAAGTAVKPHALGRPTGDVQPCHRNAVSNTRGAPATARASGRDVVLPVMTIALLGGKGTDGPLRGGCCG